MKKFELTSDFKLHFGVKLFRIKALESFNDIKEGDLGGFVEKDENLSHSGDAWVYDDAEVYGDANVYGDAKVSKKCFTLNFIYNLTLTDRHIRYGCEQRTVEEWKKFLESDEVIETNRNTDKFSIIKAALNLALEMHHYRSTKM